MYVCVFVDGRFTSGTHTPEELVPERTVFNPPLLPPPICCPPRVTCFSKDTVAVNGSNAYSYIQNVLSEISLTSAAPYRLGLSLKEEFVTCFILLGNANTARS